MNDDTPTRFAKLAKLLCAGMVSHPGSIKAVAERPTPGTISVTVSGHPDDDSKLVGREGANVRAIEELLEWAGSSQGEAVEFHLHTSPKTSPSPGTPFKENPDWNEGGVVRMIKAVCHELFHKECEIEVLSVGQARARVIVGVNHDDETSRIKFAAVSSALGKIVRAHGNAQGRKIDFSMVNI